MVKNVLWLNQEGMFIIIDYDIEIDTGDEINIFSMYGIFMTTVKVTDVKYFPSTNSLCLKIKGNGTSKEDWINRKYIDIGSSIVKKESYICIKEFDKGVSRVNKRDYSETSKILEEKYKTSKEKLIKNLEQAKKSE